MTVYPDYQLNWVFDSNKTPKGASLLPTQVIVVQRIQQHLWLVLVTVIPNVPARLPVTMICQCGDSVLESLFKIVDVDTLIYPAVFYEGTFNCGCEPDRMNWKGDYGDQS